MESPSPWNNLRFFKKTIVKGEINDIFEIDVSNYKHNETDQEKTIHEYRNRINEYEDGLTDGTNWEYYKKVINPYELVYTQKKYNNFPQSLCILHPLSRSYFKMAEMLDLIDFYKPLRGEQIRTTHVCEGPGGFIEALFDEAEKNKMQIYSSIAMTLRSKQINIPGWKRATNFLQSHKNVKIIYGEDNTGNIMYPENQEYFIDTTRNKSHIFTADGGFDFSNDYKKQEEMVFPLLVASVRIGLESIKKGGVFILKIFDFYHKSTTDLIYFLSMHFNEWTLYKPATSRPCNPEQYFIGKDFVGCSDEVLDVLRLWSQYVADNKQLTSLIKTEYTSYFKNVIENMRNTSFNNQTEYLEKVFFIIDAKDEKIINGYLSKNEKSSYDWCMRFKMPMYSYRCRSVEE
jgi:23S rRNA U2552 (ribose-2'-O)-methylase RlmE/FtsJ